MKPYSKKGLVDVQNDASHRINLSPKPPREIKIKTLLKILGVVFSGFLFLSSVQAPQILERVSAQNQSDTSSPEDRQALEDQLADLERQIEEHQKTIESYQKQGKTLTSEIKSLNAKVAKLNLQIKAINLNLAELNTNINETQRQINRSENNIDEHKTALSKAIRTIHESDSQSLAEILLATRQISDFFGNLTNIALVQTNLRTSLEEIIKLRQELVEKKEDLALQKDDVENLKAIQEAQRRGVSQTQSEKSNLLKVTKGKESEYQKILTKTKETAAQIRTRIFELLGGGELTFEKAYDYARLAEGATGVRAALVLSVLHRESLLGKNVGRCSYQTAMNPTRDVPYFLNLLSRLGIDPNSTVAKVSCPIASHGSYGGAMGPAQFIPSTWKIYESKISAISGNTPPSPWNNADAFAATAVYLKDLLESSGCRDYANTNKNVSPYQTLLERCAAAKYYAGGRWYTYRFWYGDPVVTKANEFEEDIRILKGIGA